MTPPLMIENPSDTFRVTAFNPNRIKIITNFPEEKFLVYTDSYSPYWRVFINAVPGEILRTNIAFKGVVLPAGKNEVE